MSIFDTRKKISRNAMEKLMEQSINNLLQPMEKVIKDLSISNHDLAIINTYVINCELCRYELYNNNSKDDVDFISNKIYDNFLYNKDLNEQQINIIKDLISKTKIKCDEIFSSKKLLAPLDKFSYRLFLEQLDMREDSIDSSLLSELKYCANTWVNNAKGINNAYSIDNSVEEKQKNESIDIRF